MWYEIWRVLAVVAIFAAPLLLMAWANKRSERASERRNEADRAQRQELTDQGVHLTRWDLR